VFEYLTRLTLLNYENIIMF